MHLTPPFILKSVAVPNQIFKKLFLDSLIFNPISVNFLD